MRNRRTSRGFTLTEMLFVLMLMGVASVLATRLFTGSMRVIRTAPLSQDRLAAIDRATASLRQDVWAATRMDVPDAHTLVLTTPDQTQVRWSLANDAITRIAGGHQQHWPAKIQLRVERQGDQIVLKGPDDDELRFTSQMVAMKGATE